MKIKHTVIFDKEDMAYTKGYKYQLSEDVGVLISALAKYDNFTSRYVDLTDGYLLIKTGWAWDGASGPTIDTKSSMRGGCVHDAIYYAIRQGLLPPEAKKVADKLLHDICLIDGMWHWRANGWYIAVDHLADAAADPKNKKKILRAGKGYGDLK